MLTPLEIIDITLFFVSTYVMGFLLIRYLQTRIPDFLIFTLFYFSQSTFIFSTLIHLFVHDVDFISGLIIEPAGNFGLNVFYYIASISGPTFYFWLIIYFTRGLDSGQSGLIRKVINYAYPMNLILYIPLFFNQGFFIDISMPIITIIRYLVFMPLWGGLLLVMIECLQQIRQDDKTFFKSQRTKTLWRTAVWFTLFSCCFLLLNFLEILILHLLGRNFEVISTTYLIAVLLGTTGDFIVMVISFRAPEELLLFRYQIVQAITLYKKVDLLLAPKSPSQEALVNYLYSAIRRYDGLVPKLKP